MQQQHAAAVAGPQGLAEQARPLKNAPPSAAQIPWSTSTHPPVVRQQEPHGCAKHGGGLQMLPTPPNWPPVRMQLHWVSIWQRPLVKQQAPLGHCGGGHWLGKQVLPAVQLTFGGIGQAVCAVCVQLPLASQQAPSEVRHGEPGAQVTPGVGVPPRKVHRFGSVG